MYDFFIAYANEDFHFADQLYSMLSAGGYSVFLAPKVFVGGEPWVEDIELAERESQLILLLLSARSGHFQREEILTAIELFREHPRRVVPVYLTGRSGISKIRAPIKTLHGIFWEEGTSLLSVAQRIEQALKKTAAPPEGPYKVVLATVVIVTGCDDLPEVFDRPSAYRLKSAIDSFGRSLSRTFLCSIVMGDIWFLERSSIAGHPNVISIGSTGSNALTAAITAPGGNVVRRGRESPWQIVRVANRWALFGDRAGDTYQAVSSFRECDLSKFLGEIWSGL